ncbi:unannotated protein [freshwater metagenome]|uniref:Unannotated protein n=1 Tax=freshwater metagenome TaxID=449393 RepID=A0A6J7F0R4_9ZZZZ|nr:hypothetical protein [Actinomycetota bacterium]
MSSLIIGSGYVGTLLGQQLQTRGVAVTQTSQRLHPMFQHVANGADLDRLLSTSSATQVVVCGQLTSPDIDWVLERIDGPRWLVFSSQQVTSAIAAPGIETARARETFALGRGACVVRPTMIYGHGGDKNISFAARLIRRWHMALVPGPGTQLVQPIHVDDLIDLVAAHHAAPRSGLFAAAGPEAAPLREVIEILVEVTGVRAPLITLPASIPLLSPALRLLGLRADQLARLAESKTADIGAATSAFGWEPEALGIRLEQAVREL